ncbi:DNA circularization N-terminal domain-containing protein [Chromobacterium vaccinii]|uniref:DNA circularization protein n=1 Tax=Chromobacterium vaccinii TaxID=1108595 RepID=UPI001E2B328C|nr:DNA circularization N-terminal domain-containing protein [Chromobacterium vaccinii]MCD4483747.1 DNA circularization N-terminal domain-containing protein [Chromobacterium vaccinii]
MAAQLDPIYGSWRGRPFFFKSAGAEVGRRNVLHEYPYRDIPYGEDLGRAARVYRVTALFIGPTAAKDLQLLLDDLEAPGPGELDHPYHGRLLCQLQAKASVRDPDFVGGVAEVEMVFVEAGQNLEPNAADDTDAQLDEAADEALAASGEELSRNWLDDIVGLAEEAAAVVEQLCATLESFLAPLDAALAFVDGVINAVQRIINAPLALVGRIQGRIQSLIGRLRNPFSGLSSWRKLLRGDVLHPYQTLEPNRGRRPSDAPPLASARPAWAVAAAQRIASQQRAGGGASSGGVPAGSRGAAQSGQTQTLPLMPPSLTDYVRRVLVIEAARSIPRAQFESKAELQQAREVILDALNVELQAAPDTLYPAMQALRQAVARSLAARAPTVAELDILTTHATLPALVVAYQATGGVEVAADLVARNGVRHPGFVPAGRLEVLRHG